MLNLAISSLSRTKGPTPLQTKALLTTICKWNYDQGTSPWSRIARRLFVNNSAQYAQNASTLALDVTAPMSGCTSLQQKNRCSPIKSEYFLHNSTFMVGEILTLLFELMHTRLSIVTKRSMLRT